MAGAVINMRSEATIPDSIRVSAWEHRVDRKVRDDSFCSLRPGHSIAWGAIGVFRKKVMRKLIGDAGFVFRRVDAPRTETISLSKKPVDM